MKALVRESIAMCIFCTGQEGSKVFPISTSDCAWKRRRLYLKCKKDRRAREGGNLVAECAQT